MVSEKLEELYKRYRELYVASNEHFVPCGVANQESYESSRPKLVLILKEPNDPQQMSWSLVNFLQGQVQSGLQGGHIYPMWKVIGVWSYAIHNGLPNYGDINNLQTAAEGLNCIGMTNLKKSGGGGTADDKAIREYAEKTVELWKAELEIMAPDIILSCGTFWIVTDLLEPKLKISKTSSGPYYAVWKHDNGTSLLVSIYHPAIRGRKDMLYAFLKEALLELHDKGFWHQ